MGSSPRRPSRPLLWPASIGAIRAVIPPGQPAYLVGGAVRDAFLHRPLHDIDIATPGDGRPLARHIANSMDGAYYPLDAERGVGRALIPWQGAQLIVDVAQFRGSDLATDLRKRDFTINAVAVDLNADLQAVIDPLHGLDDLSQKRLRQCGPDSISSDPVRILRAVRASVTFGLFIEPATLAQIKSQTAALAQASPERVRDELFSMLAGPRPDVAISVLSELHALELIIPETAPMHSTTQGEPHQFDVWRHTLETMKHLDALMRVVAGAGDDNLTANIRTGVAAFSLAEIRTLLREHIDHCWPGNRSHRALLQLAALLHDAGKPDTRTEEDGRIRFLNHEVVGAQLAGTRTSALRLSNGESARVATIVRHHMRPLWLGSAPRLTPRAIHRFWRATGAAGVDICLLSLADFLATHGPALDQDQWLSHLDLVHMLLEAYFVHHDTVVSPVSLLSGQDLIDQFDLSPGPSIGALLIEVSEAQVAGEIATKEEALDFIQRLLKSQSSN